MQSYIVGQFDPKLLCPCPCLPFSLICQAWVLDNGSSSRDRYQKGSPICSEQCGWRKKDVTCHLCSNDKRSHDAWSPSPVKEEQMDHSEHGTSGLEIEVISRGQRDDMLWQCWKTKLKRRECYLWWGMKFSKLEQQMN